MVNLKATRSGLEQSRVGEGRKSAPIPLDLEGFVILPENRSAVRAISDLARAVLLGKRSNVSPLVLHGLPGTGKTRLTGAALGAIATGTTTARSIPARELARPDEGPAFSDTDLAACDFLVIEDVQHLPRASSDALCELIDRRLSRRLALVVTSSAGPAGLTHLPRRLTSRLAGGLVIQMEPLGTTSRRAILATVSKGAKLAPDALDWLAEQGGGLRTALGLLQNLAQFADDHPGPIDRKTAERILAETGQPTSHPGDLPAIVKRVCSTFDVTRKELLGPSRLRRVLVPRQVAMHLAHRYGNLSLPRIGAAFGRDHTTVLHACRKVEEAIGADVKLAAIVEQLRKELR